MGAAAAAAATSVDCLFQPLDTAESTHSTTAAVPTTPAASAAVPTTSAASTTATAAVPSTSTRGQQQNIAALLNVGQKRLQHPDVQQHSAVHATTAEQQLDRCAVRSQQPTRAATAAAAAAAAAAETGSAAAVDCFFTAATTIEQHPRRNDTANSAVHRQQPPEHGNVDECSGAGQYHNTTASFATSSVQSIS